VRLAEGLDVQGGIPLAYGLGLDSVLST